MELMSQRQVRNLYGLENPRYTMGKCFIYVGGVAAFGRIILARKEKAKSHYKACLHPHKRGLCLQLREGFLRTHQVAFGYDSLRYYTIEPPKSIPIHEVSYTERAMLDNMFGPRGEGDVQVGENKDWIQERENWQKRLRWIFLTYVVTLVVEFSNKRHFIRLSVQESRVEDVKGILNYLFPHQFISPQHVYRYQMGDWGSEFLHGSA
ncbi:MAG: hypothetical protein OXB93_05690 [Cytophagales bacterium]|nr:hypothetical protein [Cytophagales bacterium]